VKGGRSEPRLGPLQPPAREPPTKTFPRFTVRMARAPRTPTAHRERPFNSFDISGQGGTTRSTYFVSALGSKEVARSSQRQVKGTCARTSPSSRRTSDGRGALGYTRNVINELQAGNNWTALLATHQRQSAHRHGTRPYGEAGCR